VEKPDRPANYPRPHPHRTTTKINMESTVLKRSIHGQLQSHLLAATRMEPPELRFGTPGNPLKQFMAAAAAAREG
jgi:hypothetical protein